MNPNATDDEVRQVVNNDQGGQIFTQAMMGNRYQEAQGAYREVQQRHEEVRRIERTIAELAQLFNDVRFIFDTFSPCRYLNLFLISPRGY